MSDEPIDRRDYGALEQKVAQLTIDVHAMKETIDGMRDMMQQAQGGWKAIALVSGIAGTVGAAIAWVASHVKFA